MSAFVTVDDLEMYLNTSITVPLDVARATLNIQLASAAVQNYCNQILERVEDDTVIFDGGGTGLLLLPELPVVNIATVKTGGPDFDTTLVDGTDYVWYSDGIVRMQPDWSTWGSVRQDVEVTYDHGYLPIPTDVQHACLRVAARMYQRPGSTGDIVQETMGSYSYTQKSFSVDASNLNARLLDDEQRILSKYKVRTGTVLPQSVS